MTVSQMWHRLPQILLIAVCGALAGRGQATEVPASWKADCVGRMTLRLPGEVEIAALSADAFRDGAAARRSAYPRSQFPDGEYAFDSMLSFMGLIFVSHPEDEARRRQFRRAAEERMAAKLKGLKENHGISERGYAGPLEVLPTPSKTSVAWRIGPAYSVYLETGRSAIWWGVADTPERMSAVERDYQTLIDGTTQRPLYTVPTEPGVCLPYTFIRDDGTHGRSITTTYRLREHPDITIWLEDSGASAPEKGANPDLYSAAGRSDFFWMQNYAGNYLTIRSLWSDLYKKVKLPAGKGVESFVAMKRKDGTEDYGYLLSIRGEPGDPNRPDLMMYVIRKASNAKAKGIEPLSREAVLEMGQTIAASIRVREVTKHGEKP